MKGLIIWAWSDCRSTMGLFCEIKRQLEECGVPCKIAFWHYRVAGCGPDMREQVGFRGDEFKLDDTYNVGEDWDAGKAVLDAHPGWNHLFGVYQVSKNFRDLLLEAKRRGEHVAIIGEAPCEMYTGLKAFAHQIYLRSILRWRVRRVVDAADFFVSLSGYNNEMAEMIGWSKSKIIPFGYFPPPIEGTESCCRSGDSPFMILSSGIMAKYRGVDILVEALRILKDRKVEYRAVITQNGPLYDDVKRKVELFHLPVELPGFVEMTELVRLYESCSVYVGSGRSEPWGMRLNDVLNCGAPLVVNRGMGGVKMIDDLGCGLSFEKEDAVGLADCLERLISNRESYAFVAEKAACARDQISPEVKAGELLHLLCAKFEHWRCYEK